MTQPVPPKREIGEINTDIFLQIRKNIIVSWFFLILFIKSLWF